MAPPDYLKALSRLKLFRTLSSLFRNLNCLHARTWEAENKVANVLPASSLRRGSSCWVEDAPPEAKILALLHALF